MSSLNSRSLGTTTSYYTISFLRHFGFAIILDALLLQSSVIPALPRPRVRRFPRQFVRFACPCLPIVVCEQQQAPAISNAIQLLPLYSMALQKNLSFRGGTDVRSDERANVMSQLASMPVDHSRCFTYPRMFTYVLVVKAFFFVFLQSWLVVLRSRSILARRHDVNREV